MLKGKMICNAAYTSGDIDPHIYGSFAEHMGRVIYSGIYEPGHRASDADGFRTDVMDAVKDMGIYCVRYPGGNFVSCYDWLDGVGPKAARPRRRDPAWRSIETNEFGTNEFMLWARRAGVEPMLTVNLGTGGIEDAIRYVEYVNLPVGTKYSDMRAEHGEKQPYGVKLWCLGNEMDGIWQIGHKTMEEYGRLAAETGKAMKLIDPSIRLIACGSSKSDMPTYPEWDLRVLEHVYGIADYLSLHQYYGGQQAGTAAFLAQSADFESYISAIRAAIRLAGAKRRMPPCMRISVDEWGVWAYEPETVTKQVDDTPWQIAPAISEQIYTMEDTLLFASMLMAMVRNADIVKIGCQSLITNISACIMTERGGVSWKQPIYYAFQALAKHARGKVLRTVTDIPAYDAGGLKNVPSVDALAVWNDEGNELTLFTVNRGDNESAEITLEAQGFSPKAVKQCLTLCVKDKKMTNLSDHNAVTPRESDCAMLNGNRLIARLEPLSFQMVRLEL